MFYSFLGFMKTRIVSNELNASHQLLGLSSGIIFLLTLPPVNWFWLLPVCFVPLIIASHRYSILRAAFAGFLFGIIAYICIHLSLFSWGRDAVAYSVLILGVFFSLWPVLTQVLVRFLPGWAKWAAFPIAYYCLNLIGDQLLSIPVSLSISYPVDLIDARGLFGAIGAIGVDLFICTINALVAAVVVERKRRYAVGLIPLLVVLVLLHYVPLQTSKVDNAPLKAITVDNAMSFSDVMQIGYSLDSRERIYSEMSELTKRAITMEPDLILWPEGGNGSALRQVAYAKNDLQKLANFGNYRLIAGSKDYDKEGNSFNVAEYVVNGGLVAQAQKGKPVPLLESHLSVGSGSVFDVLNHKVGVGICFDSDFPMTIHQLVHQGADSIVLLSNDSSFGVSALTDMHLAYAGIRALESGRELLFVSNTGPSILLGANGRYKSGYKSTREPMLQQHKIDAYQGISLYVRYPYIASLFLLLILAFYIVALQAWGARDDH